MKYVVAALAIVAAVAALIVRPPLATTPGVPEAHGVAGEVPGGATPADGTPGESMMAGRVASGPAGGPGREPETPLRKGRRAVVVYVAGEVLRPGVYSFAPDDRIEAALARAGGPKPDADLVAVNLAAPLSDGEEVAFPKIGEPAARTAGSRSPRPRASHRPRRHRRNRTTGAGVAPADDPALRAVDLNSAGAAELEAVPGIGPALAARIVEYREQNGPFTSTDELADISGITPGLQEKISDYLTVR